MDVVRPATFAEALDVKSQRPDLMPIAGGTDLMVSINFGRLRPPGLIDLRHLAGIDGWSTDGDTVRIGAGVPYATIIRELGTVAPGLAMAARTVGSPQIRNAGTVGGNLGTASPAGDAHPPLLACRAAVEIASARGVRTVPITDFFTGPKRSVLDPDELVAAVLLPAHPGPQQFAKIGTRNAMVIAVCSFAVALDPAARRVGAAIGSAAPTPRLAVAAEDFLAGELTEGDFWGSRAALPDTAVTRFGELVASAASPVDDVRGSAAYRRHALAVLAARTVRWAWADYQAGNSARDGRRTDPRGPVGDHPAGKPAGSEASR